MSMIRHCLADLVGRGILRVDPDGYAFTDPLVLHTLREHLRLFDDGAE